jgi:hypothetical protein
MGILQQLSWRNEFRRWPNGHSEHQSEPENPRCTKPDAICVSMIIKAHLRAMPRAIGDLVL